MEIKFKYNGKIISTPNLEKKLKRMKISIDDIEIIKDDVKKEVVKEENNNNIKLYYFINKTNGYKHCSIYDECPENFERCNRETYRETNK